MSQREIPGPKGQKRLSRTEYVRAFSKHFTELGGDSVKETDGETLECTMGNGKWGHMLNPEFFSDYWALRGARFLFEELNRQLSAIKQSGQENA